MKDLLQPGKVCFPGVNSPEYPQRLRVFNGVVTAFLWEREVLGKAPGPRQGEQSAPNSLEGCLGTNLGNEATVTGAQWQSGVGVALCELTSAVDRIMAAQRCMCSTSYDLLLRYIAQHREIDKQIELRLLKPLT